MSKSRWGIISPITIVLLVAGWVLLLIPSITSAQRNLSLATVTSGDREPATFGILSWEGGSFGSGTSAAFRTNNGNTVGYRAMLDMPYTRPHPIYPEQGDIPENRPFTVTMPKDTEALVLFPVSLAILALATIFFAIGAANGSWVWVGLATLFALVGVALGWAAWGFAFQLTDVVERALSRYTSDTYAVLTEINVQRGNAIWPGLVGVILATLALILMVVKLATRPRTDKTNRPDMSETATKTTAARQGSTSSNSTLA